MRVGSSLFILDCSSICLSGYLSFSLSLAVKRRARLVAVHFELSVCVPLCLSVSVSLSPSLRQESRLALRRLLRAAHPCRILCLSACLSFFVFVRWRARLCAVCSELSVCLSLCLVFSRLSSSSSSPWSLYRLSLSRGGPRPFNVYFGLSVCLFLSHCVCSSVRLWHFAVSEIRH